MMVLLGIQLIPLLGRDVIRESVESHSIPSDIEVEEEQIEKEVEPKRARGPTKMLDVWEMEDGDLIIVNLDKYGRPIGEEGTTLTRFIGSVARRYQYAPINYKSWKVMPNDYKEEMLKLIEKKKLHLLYQMIGLTQINIVVWFIIGFLMKDKK
ncbi:uncharacterized protein [Cicer arietinum]|uniref:uncharacterized protein isoform X3 n=1 Tax=Cicer arietinum TaxID=3827 RepID=UPI003CC6787A